jgi:hypothetical protein
MLTRFLLLFAALASVHGADDGDETTSFYCCESENASPVCSLGGCQYAIANLASFHRVDDCSQCSAGAMRNNTTPTTFASSCTFCAATGDQCVQLDTFGSTFGCAQADASRPLVQFAFSLLAANGSNVGPIAQPFCCYYRASNDTDGAAERGVYQMQESQGGCPFGNAGLSLVAFAEHDFAFACPARPPCEADCHGHGLCAGSQCVCQRNYFGDSCASRCDRSNCVMGSCYNDPSRSAALEDASLFDDSYDAMFADSADDNATLPSPACHCNPFVVGAKCDRCRDNYVGANCSTFCNGAPCNGEYMTGMCKTGGCECRTGYAYDALLKKCSCAGACQHGGLCTANNTCSCVGHWNGTGCTECACLNDGQCSPMGVCMCAANYGGDLCDKCADNYFDLASNCTTFCLDRTHINVTYNGTDTFYPAGMCHHNALCNATTGACDCPAHAVGAHCEACEPYYFGETCGQYCHANTTCGGLGTCNNGTGLCDCFKSGFGGNCTTCLPDFYPAGVCTTMCNAATTCGYNGHCDDQGKCVCKNYVVYQEGNCNVQIWVIIVPCVVVILLMGGFVYYLWRKKKATDEFGEPLLGSGW